MRVRVADGAVCPAGQWGAGGAEVVWRLSGPLLGFGHLF